MSVEFTHNCDKCSDPLQHSRDECLCVDCLKALMEEHYERGHEDGYKKGFEQGEQSNPNK